MDEPDLSVEGPVEYVATSTLSTSTIHIEPPLVPEPVSTGLSETESEPHANPNLNPKSKLNLPIPVDSNAETESATESEDETAIEPKLIKRAKPKPVRASRRSAKPEVPKPEVTKTEVSKPEAQIGNNRKSSRVSARNQSSVPTKKPPARRKSTRTK